MADRAGGVRTRSCGGSSATTAAAEGVGAGVEYERPVLCGVVKMDCLLMNPGVQPG